jgi:flagellar motor protein MotB
VAAKGGGAWKVAYADFVTAMMAFFLVMWICGQDQRIKRAVSTYFSDPFNSSSAGNTRKPTSTGSVTEAVNHGSVPKADAITGGQGRGVYTFPNEKSIATKLVSDWLHGDEQARAYWRVQAQIHRSAARKDAKDNADELENLDKNATRKLAEQLKEEFTRDVRPQVIGLYRELMLEIIADVNWLEIAEDLYLHADD